MNYRFLLFFILSVCCFFSIQAQSALNFGGTNAYVAFGNNSKLGLASFTLECWFYKTGNGATTSTGAGGVTAVPLITKGRGEADGSNVDCNYFFGISSGNVLAADFEEGASGSSPGLNHPVTGVTVIQNNTWYHACVTYDGTTWNLYLNGKLESSLKVSQPVQSASIQHSAIGSALTSTGAAQGYFAGRIDEARIWNYARTQAEIRSTVNSEIKTATTGLVARWGLDEGIGTTVRDSSGNAVNGTITGANYSWVNTVAPFNINFPPSFTITSPLANACVSKSANLSVNVSDEEKDSITVKFYGRKKSKGPADFTIIPIPDVQFYTQQANGGHNEIFKTQTKWMVSKKD